MSVPLAYLGVIIIWSTTPIAIQWSSHGVGFLFGVSSRMALGAVLALMLATLLGKGMRWNRTSVHSYLIAGLTIYLAMLGVYWSAQRIPSGWISLRFGLSPLVTALLTHFLVSPQEITREKGAGLVIALTGLGLIFATGLSLSRGAILGVIALLASVVIHSGGSVWLKQIHHGNSAMITTCGGLLVASPLFVITWFIFGEGLPETIPQRSVAAILYLALFGSVIGFALFYYVLSQIEATRVALITLITPVIALTLGNLLNGEPLTARIVLGSALILLGLALFEVGQHFLQRMGYNPGAVCTKT